MKFNCICATHGAAACLDPDRAQPLPASAWGADAARIAAREDQYRASLNPLDEDDDYREQLRAALRTPY